MAVEIRDVAPGLWLWRQRHWEWREGFDWEPEVSSFVVESGGEVVLLDPLAPAPPDAAELGARLAARPPTAIVIVKTDHTRDVDYFAHWYDIPAFGPRLFEPGLAPEVHIEPIMPRTKLPGGLIALYDGRGSTETPIWAPEQRAIVFADGLTGNGGVLRVWDSPVRRQGILPALRAMLDLPFEHVLTSHGTPVHTRADFEAALEREPWSPMEEDELAP